MVRPFIVSISLLLLLLADAKAATISPGNVTQALGPMFFFDDAVTGGGDATISQASGASYTRSFAGLLSPNQGLTQLTLNGFGCVFSSATASNTATSMTVTFTYLGADEAVGGTDDVVMGSATGDIAYSIAGEYVFAFDAPITASLNITGTRFRIQVAPSKVGGGAIVQFKTGTLTYEAGTFPKFSVSGFVSRRVNLAKHQPCRTDSVNEQRLGSYLTDGIVGNDNRWESDDTGPHSARVDLPFPMLVGSAHVFSGVNDGSAQADFKVQYLNDSTWIDIPGATITGNTSTENNLIFTTPVTAASFRIFDSSDTAMSIKEFALYPPNGAAGYPLGTDVTLNLAQQRPTLASANTTGNFALLAVDGRVNRSSKWQTTTLGAQWLEIDLRVSSKVGSAHLYSGLPGAAPLSDFALRYWDGSAWQDVPGGLITGNASVARVINFTTPVTTSKMRLEFTNTGTASVQELCFFPANNNLGYPIGTSIIGAAPITATYDEYHDAFHKITNATASRYLSVNAGVPGLNQTGQSTAQGQYQILLNIANGTYRLRNRSTGNFLSGAQLATTPGAPLRDAPYSALPDQDWLLDAIDGTNFYLVNQWSGLVVDTQGGSTSDGAPLVQNVNTGANSQRWQLVYDTHSPKKGVGGSNFASAFNANWLYNWGLSNSITPPPDVIFNPMQWGDFNWPATAAANSVWKLSPQWRSEGEPISLLGFNEPDKTDQSNMLVTDAVTLWPRLQSTDMPLVAPCPASLTTSWMSSFYSQAEALGYRMDYTPMHSYGSPQGGDSDALISGLQTAYNNWGRPMWLTEFSFVDWAGTNTWTEEDCYNCLAEFLWRAESLDWLRKYALFVFKEDATWPNAAQPWSTVGARSNSYDINGNLTPFGQVYAAWDNVTQVQSNKVYYVHNKGTRKRLANTLATSPNGRSIRVNDSSVTWKLVPTGGSNLFYITSMRDGRRLSYINNGSVNFVASTTTGTAVEWRPSGSQDGWQYLTHPATTKRLQLAYNNTTSVATYTMAASTTTTDAVQWRFIVPYTYPVWTGASGTSWTTAGSWEAGIVPINGNAVLFNASSTANLATLLNNDFHLTGLSVTTPPNAVSIGGTNLLTIGGDGIDLSTSTQNLTLTSPLAMSAAQTWSVASGRILNVNGGTSGTTALTISGTGKVSLGGIANHTGNTTIDLGSTLQMAVANALPGSSLTLNGSLNLNGYSQTLKALTGSGVVDNSGAAASLTLGSNDIALSLAITLQNTGSPLTLIKLGSGNLTLPIANAHSGGLINHGTGLVIPQNNASFGTGPIVMNASTLYASSGAFTFTNELTLNGATLRVGGGSGRSITWSGPVTITADSGISADAGTSGVTVSGNINNTGFTLGCFSNNTSNTISGIISGTGMLTVTSSILNLNAANTFSGTVRSVAGSLRLNNANALQNATLDMNSADLGSVNLNNLNATLGALTGTRNLSLGSGTVSVGNNNLSTGYGGVLSNSGSLIKIGSGTLTLSNTQSYTGSTTVSSGTLTLGANNALPTTPVAIGNATLDAATFTDTLGTLDVTSTAKINLGTGATLAFSNSSAVDWTGGTLTINGAFVSGSSIRFGTTNAGLTTTQRALISIPGFTNIAINASGYLTATPTAITLFNTWSNTLSFGADANNDGISNGMAWVLGAASTSATISNLLPTVDTTTDPAYVTFTYRRSDAANGAAGITIAAQYGNSLGSWTTAVHDGNNVIISTTNDIAPGVDSLQVKIKRSLGAGGRLFVCLQVRLTP